MQNNYFFDFYKTIMTEMPDFVYQNTTYIDDVDFHDIEFINDDTLDNSNDDILFDEISEDENSTYDNLNIFDDDSEVTLVEPISIDKLLKDMNVDDIINVNMDKNEMKEINDELVSCSFIDRL